jgi:amino acid transporter, AAT family
VHRSLYFRAGCEYLLQRGLAALAKLASIREMPDAQVQEAVLADGSANSAILEREAGLRRDLTPRQLSMIAVGGAIGTGLFLGSVISVNAAGPAVLLSYAAAATIALVLMWALGEMTIAHPVAGSFGVYAEIYLHPWAGFAMRYSYWLGQVIAIGSEMVAVSIYCNHWFPAIPAWFWIAGFSVALISVNASSISNFGTFEYWFAMIKVVTIAIFIVLGAAVLLGIGFPALGPSNYTRWGGFLPRGWTGVLLGIPMAVFSYLGIEIVAVTSGEAKDPRVALPRAMRWTFVRLGVLYIGGLAIVVGVVPWHQLGLGESPFVRVFESSGIPAAAVLMNFVVLTAALSSVNCNLYLTARMLFSLARGSYAPAALGRLTKRGVPLIALLASSAGMLAALFLERWFRGTTYIYMMGAAFFGGLFVWLMIFVTHLAFRRRTASWTQLPVRFGPRGPWSSLFGVAALSAVLVSTWWVPGLRITLVAGLPWLLFISLCYFVWSKARISRSGVEASKRG